MGLVRHTYLTAIHTAPLFKDTNFDILYTKKIVLSSFSNQIPINFGNIHVGPSVSYRNTIRMSVFRTIREIKGGITG